MYPLSFYHVLLLRKCHALATSFLVSFIQEFGASPFNGLLSWVPFVSVVISKLVRSSARSERYFVGAIRYVDHDPED
jgi:hypothetical protein